MNDLRRLSPRASGGGARIRRAGIRRGEIDRRLSELAQTIGTLSKLLGYTPTVPLGLTDAIRLVTRGAGLPMTPVDVRDRLQGMGFDMAKYTNDLAAVHTILKRLNDAGELRLVPGRTGSRNTRPAARRCRLSCQKTLSARCTITRRSGTR